MTEGNWAMKEQFQRTELDVRSERAGGTSACVWMRETDTVFVLFVVCFNRLLPYSQRLGPQNFFRSDDAEKPVLRALLGPPAYICALTEGN